jgi:hypothetical protein
MRIAYMTQKTQRIVLKIPQEYGSGQPTLTQPATNDIFNLPR